MEFIRKRILAKAYCIKIYFKSLFVLNGFNSEISNLDEIFKKYSDIEKIVIVCSGPSANKLTLSKKNLYLITNSAYTLVRGHNFLYCLNDRFFIKKILSDSSFLKNNQELVFFANNTNYDTVGQKYLIKNISLLNNKKKYFISSTIGNNNYKLFSDFYMKRNLPIKIQNSGVFMLLFGYFLSNEIKVPLEIYGLDCGIGGDIHFDKKGIVGTSVIKERVKHNVKMYLSYMYKEKLEISNFSHFYPFHK